MPDCSCFPSDARLPARHAKFGDRTSLQGGASVHVCSISGPSDTSAEPAGRNPSPAPACCEAVSKDTAGAHQDRVRKYGARGQGALRPCARRRSRAENCLDNLRVFRAGSALKYPARGAHLQLLLPRPGAHARLQLWGGAPARGAPPVRCGAIGLSHAVSAPRGVEQKAHQLMDIYYPPASSRGAGRPLPVVLFVHGGSWSAARRAPSSAPRAL
jgi:hypothetical protein